MTHCNNLCWIFVFLFFLFFSKTEKIYTNGFLRDVISNSSICTHIRHSHDRSSNDDKSKTPDLDQSTSMTGEKVMYFELLSDFIWIYVDTKTFYKRNPFPNIQIPSPPTNCCMSGCANCVWIKYAEEISSQLRGGSDIVREIIIKEVQDTNMRSFLEMELRMLKLKEKKWWIWLRRDCINWRI